MASLILGLFPQALIASSLFPTKIGSNVPNCQKLCIRLVVATARISIIGKTKRRRLHDRKTEHFKAMTSSSNASAIAEHVTSTMNRRYVER